MKLASAVQDSFYSSNTKLCITNQILRRWRQKLTTFWWLQGLGFSKELRGSTCLCQNWNCFPQSLPTAVEDRCEISFRRTLPNGGSSQDVLCQKYLVLLPCSSTSAYILSTAAPGWPNISLGTSLHSWGEFFSWHIFSKQHIRETDLYRRKPLLNPDLFNMLRLHLLSYLWPLTKCNAWHGTVTGDLPRFLNYHLHLPPLSHGVVTYCNKDLWNKSLLINPFL